MRAYSLISGAFFALVAILHVLRVIGSVPVLVADIQIPVWMSAPAAILTAALAVWAFRLSTQESNRS